MLRHEPRHEMDRLILDAGYGTSALSRLGVRIARRYHLWVAVFTASLILAETLPIAPSIAWRWLGAYAIYFVLRKVSGDRIKKQFYLPLNQVIRVFVGILIVTFFLYSLGSQHQQTHLWLLYLLVLQVASKHCSTKILIGAVAAVYGVLLGLHLWVGWPVILFSPLYWQPLLVKYLWIGLFIFILHYLVRNIDARDTTITSYRLVSALADQLDTLHSPSARWSAMLEKCIEVFPAQSAFLWQCDYATRQLRMVASVPGQQPITEFELIELDADNVIASAARSADGCFWDSAIGAATFVSGRTMRLVPQSNALRQHSLILVPVILQEGHKRSPVSVLGMSFATSHAPRPPLWPEYYALLEAMVHHLKPLLMMDRAVQDLRLLDDVGREISARVNTADLVESLLDAVVDRLGFEFATVSMVDEERGLIRCMAGRNVSEQWIKESTHPITSHDIQADIIASGKTEILEGWDDRFDRKIWTTFGHSGVIRIFAPIRVTDRLTRQRISIGTVEAGYHKTNRSVIDDQQVAMLHAIISHAAIAIEKTRTVERLERKTDAMTSLHSVNQAIGAARDLSQVLEEIGQSALRVLDADIVLLYRYSAEDHQIGQPLVYGDIWGNKPLSLTIREGGVLDRLITEKSSYFSVDALNDPHLSDGHLQKPADGIKHRSFTQRQNIRSFAGVPLLVDGQIVGLLCANYRKRHRFALDEEQTIELFAQLAALAIKNAEVNAIIRDNAAREERLRLARELHDSTAQHLPAIKIMTANVREAQKIDPQATPIWLEKIDTTAERAIRDIKVTVFQLRQMERQKAIGEAIGDLAAQIQEFFNLEITTKIALTEPLPPVIENAAFAVIREAVVNSARHAAAQSGRICLATSKGKLFLSVSDDGVGFDPTTVDSIAHRGIGGMRERIQLVGGKLIVRSKPGRGTAVIGRIRLGR